MHYTFRPGPEFVWFVIVAAIVAVLTALVDFDPATITDWRTWAIAIGAGAVRAAVAAALVAFGSGRVADASD